jgi:hypothetical protein
MTRDDVLAMQPGRELDALVAEKVMGWAELWTDSKNYMAYPPCEQKFTIGEAERHPVWPYSTDIAAAWEVVEKIKHMNLYIATHVPADGRITCIVDDDINGELTCDEVKEYQVVADTAPEAICKAALLAVMEVDK